MNGALTVVDECSFSNMNNNALQITYGSLAVTNAVFSLVRGVALEWSPFDSGIRPEVLSFSSTLYSSPLKFS